MLKSPTSILNSIQRMKTNLRNDKQQLRIIKTNFVYLDQSTNRTNRPCEEREMEKVRSKGRRIYCDDGENDDNKENDSRMRENYGGMVRVVEEEGMEWGQEKQAVDTGQQGLCGKQKSSVRNSHNPINRNLPKSKRIRTQYGDDKQGQYQQQQQYNQQQEHENRHKHRNEEYQQPQYQQQLPVNIPSDNILTDTCNPSFHKNPTNRRSSSTSRLTHSNNITSNNITTSPTPNTETSPSTLLQMKQLKHRYQSQIERMRAAFDEERAGMVKGMEKEREGMRQRYEREIEELRGYLGMLEGEVKGEEQGQREVNEVGCQCQCDGEGQGDLFKVNDITLSTIIKTNQETQTPYSPYSSPLPPASPLSQPSQPQSPSTDPLQSPSLPNPIIEQLCHKYFSNEHPNNSSSSSSSNPNQQHFPHSQRTKYEHIINCLLQENTKLHMKLERLCCGVEARTSNNNRNGDKCGMSSNNGNSSYGSHNNPTSNNNNTSINNNNNTTKNSFFKHLGINYKTVTSYGGNEDNSNEGESEVVDKRSVDKCGVIARYYSGKQQAQRGDNGGRGMVRSCLNDNNRFSSESQFNGNPYNGVNGRCDFIEANSSDNYQSNREVEEQRIINPSNNIYNNNNNRTMINNNNNPNLNNNNNNNHRSSKHSIIYRICNVMSASMLKDSHINITNPNNPNSNNPNNPTNTTNPTNFNPTDANNNPTPRTSKIPSKHPPITRPRQGINVSIPSHQRRLHTQGSETSKSQVFGSQNYLSGSGFESVMGVSKAIGSEERIPTMRERGRNQPSFKFYQCEGDDNCDGDVRLDNNNYHHKNNNNNNNNANHSHSSNHTQSSNNSASITTNNQQQNSPINQYHRQMIAAWEDDLSENEIHDDQIKLKTIKNFKCLQNQLL